MSRSPLRQLTLIDLDQAVEEARRLLTGGYVAGGNWTLGQMCRHLRLVLDPAIDGYPWQLKIFTPVRPLIRRMFLPKLFSNDPPRNMRTLGAFIPAGQLDDAAEVAAYAASVQRFQRYDQPFDAHPFFGRVDRRLLEKIHASHAAHHFRFLEPAASGRSDQGASMNQADAGTS